MNEKGNNIISIGIAHEEATLALYNRDFQYMKQIWESVEGNPDIIGDSDDFHNFSVVYSKADDYLTAYKIVVRGLIQFPYNTDLLADAIYYGSNCGKIDECKTHIKVLLDRPKASWTWRAFSFLIDYLTACWDWEKETGTIEQMVTLALEIAKDFQKYNPNEESSYVAEYKVHKVLAKLALERKDEQSATEHNDAALKILKDTVFDERIAALQCALRYMDIMFKNQQFQEVIRVADRALRSGQDTPSARLGYFVYLSAQSREMLLYAHEDWKNRTEEIESIFAEYSAANSSDIDQTYKDNIKTRVTILSKRSGVPVPSSIDS